jgi:heme oxygenase (biliverdin-IX-beta and delta-forming)
MSSTMSQTATRTPETSRALRLRAATHDMHERLDSSITSVATFASAEGYRRFLAMQYLFHRDIDALYHDAALQALLPGLSERRRLPLIECDLTDLDAARPEGTAPVFAPDRPIDPATALGWLYVAEGSNLGASLLRKEVARIGLSDSHGASHLAPAAEGPAAYWRQFTAALDSAVFDDAGDDRAVAGARAAFARVQDLADACVRQAC